MIWRSLTFWALLCDALVKEDRLDPTTTRRIVLSQQIQSYGAWTHVLFRAKNIPMPFLAQHTFSNRLPVSSYGWELKGTCWRQFRVRGTGSWNIWNQRLQWMPRMNSSTKGMNRSTKASPGMVETDIYASTNIGRSPFQMELRITLSDPCVPLQHGTASSFHFFDILYIFLS